MITRVPVLDFLRGRVGVYRSVDGQHWLALDACGYGFTLRASNASGLLSGVLGVSGRALELHALVGLPNVACFRWDHDFCELAGAQEFEIKLHSSDLDSSVTLVFQGERINFGVTAGAGPSVLHELLRA